MEYRVIWDSGNCIDGFDVDSFDEGIERVIDILIDWQVEESSNWKIENDCLFVTEKQIEDYNYMIYNCFAHVCEYDEDGYCTEYRPSDEQLSEIGWDLFEDYTKYFNITYKIIDEEM